MELRARQSKVLKSVVEEYVATALPVSSEGVARRHGAGASPATIRNEMAHLEEMGLLKQPHTSAGRAPSELGYRYYVEHLMEETELPLAEERMIRHQFHQVEGEVGQWSHLASALLAQIVGSAAMVASLRARRSRIRRVDLVPVQGEVGLMVVVLQAGGMLSQLVRLDTEAQGEELVATTQRLRAMVEGRTAEDVSAMAGLADGQEERLLRLIARLVGDVARAQPGEVCYEGLGRIASQPEFARSEKLRPVLEALESGLVVSLVLSEAPAREIVRVSIGSEHGVEEIKDCSVVVSGYGLGDDLWGVLGVVGPTRLPYWRAVPAVRLMARMLDALVEESFRN